MKAFVYLFLLIFILSGCNNMGNTQPIHGVTGEEISLPDLETQSDISVEEALENRRSVRNYSEEPFTLKEISQLLRAAQGLTEGKKRTAPSAGATYPMEIYITVDNVEELDPGVYYYNNHKQQIEKIAEGEVSEKLSNAAWGQKSVRISSANIVITAEFERTTSRYGSRGEQYVYMEAGHISQNIYLQAETLNLGTVAIGAFEEEKVKEVLKIDNKFEPIYIMPVGKK